MDSKIIDLIRSEDQEKIDVVKQIIKYHPGYGVERGYSWYVGGMKDTGEWKVETLFSARLVELEIFLNELLEIDRKVEEQRKEQERIANLSKKDQDKILKERWEQEKNMFDQFWNEKTTFLMWGK